MSDEQTRLGPDAAAPAGKKPGAKFKLAALALATVCLVIGAACWLCPPRGGDGNTEFAATSDLPAGMDALHLFQGWTKPDFVVVLTGQQHGYLLPCGCSEPQKGGLERRYNLIKRLENHGWPVVALDLGDVPQTQGPASLANVQGLIKYRYAMQAMKLIGYTAVGLGEYEAGLSLSHAVDEYALNESKPALLSANLVKKAELFPDADRKRDEWGKSYVGSWQVATVGGTRVGAVGVTSVYTPASIAALIAAGKLPPGSVIPPSVGGQVTASDRKIAFADPDKVIPVELAKMPADFRVLLYQGPVELARVLAAAFPPFNVILCLDSADDPPARPDIVKDKVTGKETLIVRLGHKSKYVGVVGVYAKPGQSFDMRYELVPMLPAFASTPAEAKDHPIRALMERYTRELKDDDYLARYGLGVPHPMQAALKDIPRFAEAKTGYIGSAACGKCHEPAYTVWKNSDHSHAYDTLVRARNPSLREYDAECIVCHTVGFRYEGGFKNARATPLMKDVGCESCHGPGEIHKKNPNNPAIHALINPWKGKPDKIQGMCQTCHDEENDVNWNFAKWKTKNIIHMTPPPE
jgi:hypothetical protein